jgi:hypothetical protein
MTTTTKIITRSNANVIKGTYTGTDTNGEFNWECPFSGEWKTCSGEFDMDEKYIHSHDVRDEDGNLLYIVTQ